MGLLATCKASIIEKVGKVQGYFLSRIHSPSYKYVDTRRSIVNVTAESSTINSGLNTDEALKLLDKGAEIALRSIEASRLAQQRTEMLIQPLKEDLKALPIEKLQTLADPDVQYAILDATVASARTGNDDVRKILRALIRGRITGDTPVSGRQQQMVYSEAIKTLSRLTIEQQQILAVRLYIGGIYAEDATFDGIVQTMKKLVASLPERFTWIDVQMLEVTSCGTFPVIQNGRYSTLGLAIRQMAPGVFTKPIGPEDAKRLPSELLIERDGNTFFVPFKGGANELVYYMLSRGASKDEAGFAAARFEEHFVPSDVIEERVISAMGTDGARLKSLWATSGINRLLLTPIGQVIGATYLEEMYGIDVDISFDDLV